MTTAELSPADRDTVLNVKSFWNNISKKLLFCLVRIVAASLSVSRASQVAFRSFRRPLTQPALPADSETRPKQKKRVEVRCLPISASHRLDQMGDRFSKRHKQDVATSSWQLPE